MKDFEGKFSRQFSVHSQPYYVLYGKIPKQSLSLTTWLYGIASHASG